QEVLLLLTGMIPERFAALAIDHLLHTNIRWRLHRGQPPRNALLALQMTSEFRKTAALTRYARTITRALTSLLTTAADWDADFDNSLAEALESMLPHLLAGYGTAWGDAEYYQQWYRNQRRRLADGYFRTTALTAARLYV